MSPLDRKFRIESLKKQLKEIHQKLEVLKNSCVHRFMPLTQEELKDKWCSVSAICTVCDKDFGWRCKNSIDGVCHYYSNDGFIDLIDGRKVPTPPEHGPDYETDDSCIFCGQPSERK